MDSLKDDGYIGLYLDPDVFLISLYLRNIFQVSRFIDFRLKICIQQYVNRWKYVDLRGKKRVELNHMM